MKSLNKSSIHLRDSHLNKVNEANNQQNLIAQLPSELRGTLKKQINDNKNIQNNSKNKKRLKDKLRNRLKKEAIKSFIPIIVSVLGGVATVGSCSAAMFTNNSNDNTVIEQKRGQKVKFSINDDNCFNTKANSDSDTSISSTRQAILDWCASHLGVPYASSGWSGSNPDSMTSCTCTSFVALAYKCGANLDIGSGNVIEDRRAGDPSVFLEQIQAAGNWHDWTGDTSVFQPGDVIIYGICHGNGTDSRPYQHAAIYAGDGQVYEEAGSESRKTSITTVDNCVGGGYPLSGGGSTNTNGNNTTNGNSSRNSNSSTQYTNPTVNGEYICGDQSIGEEIARVAVQCALVTKEHVHAPHDWPWIDSPWRSEFDSRAANQIALCEATLKKNGGNSAVASCTQCAATIISAVADPDMSGTYNGISGSAGPGAAGNGFLPYLLARPDIYKEVDTTLSTIKPGDILANDHHDAIWVGTVAAQVKFSDTTANVYEGGYNDGWKTSPDGNYSEVITFEGATYYNCGAYASLPSIDEYGETELKDYRVFRVIQKNPNPQYEFIDYESLLSGNSSNGDGGADEHSEAIVSACNTTPSTGKGWCAAWVSNVYKNAGLTPPSGNGNSILNNSSTISTDWSKIKAGQIVSCQATPTEDGAQYGHTGIYIGNGNVMDNIGYIRTISLTQWVSDYSQYGWVKYGWPW